MFDLDLLWLVQVICIFDLDLFLQVSLSLEEKQRLAREQEAQQHLKSQSPLQPKPTASQSHAPKVKDLTSTLLNTNLNQMSKPAPNYTPSFGSTASSFNSNTSTFVSSGSTFGSYGGGSTGTFGSGMANTGPGYTQTFPQATPGLSGQISAVKPDLSSFDDLLPGKPKPTMNQMGQSSQMGFGIQQGMMGNQMGRGMGNQGLMGNMGMMGPRMGQPPMGNAGMMTNQGMMGNMGMNQSGGSFFGQPMITNQVDPSHKAKSDFDDLFG